VVFIDSSLHSILVVVSEVGNINDENNGVEFVNKIFKDIGKVILPTVDIMLFSELLELDKSVDVSVDCNRVGRK